MNSSQLPKGMILKAQQQTVPVQGRAQKRGKRALRLHEELFEDPKSEAENTKRQREEPATNGKSLGITQPWGAVRPEPQDDRSEREKRAARNESVSLC